MEAISSQQITGNALVFTSSHTKETRIFEEKSWRKPIHIQSNKTYSWNRKQTNDPSRKTTAPDNIWDVVKITLRAVWYYSIFANYEKMSISNIFSAPFLRSLLPLKTKIICLRISFKVKKTDIDNKYDLYSIICAYGSSIIEGLNLTVSYTPVSVVKYLSRDKK